MNKKLLFGALVLCTIFFMSNVGYAAGDVTKIMITSQESISKTEVPKNKVEESRSGEEETTQKQEIGENFSGPWWQETLHDF